MAINYSALEIEDALSRQLDNILTSKPLKGRGNTDEDGLPLDRLQQVHPKPYGNERDEWKKLGGVGVQSGLPECIVPGVSMSLIADGCGLSLSCVSRVFNGKRDPRLATLRTIAAYLNMSIDEVLQIIEDRQRGKAAR